MKTGPGAPGEIFAVIEVPKGSINKYEYDHEVKEIVLNRVLHTSFAYPGDYGFIPRTLGEDGDPLDCLLLMEEGTFPGCIVLARPVAVLKLGDENGDDAKIICVPVKDPRYEDVKDLADLPEYMKNHICHFFSEYKRFEKGKFVKIEGWGDAEEAKRVIGKAMRKFEEAA